MNNKKLCNFLLLDNSFFQTPFWKEKRVFSRAEAWLDLQRRSRTIAESVYVNGKLIHVGKGELIASLSFLEKAWGWSTKKVRKFKQDLKSFEYLDERRECGETVLIIKAPRSYAKEGQGKDTEKGKARARRGQGEDTKHNTDIYKTDKQIIYSPDSPQGDAEAFPTIENQFLEAWNNLPDIFPKLRTPLRKDIQRQLNARAKESGWIETWREALALIPKDPHCCGENDRDWVATPSYFLRPEAIDKLTSRANARKLQNYKPNYI